MDYNEILSKGLTDVQADLTQKQGAVRALSAISDAMGTAASLGVPWAGQAAAVLKVVNAAVGALQGPGSANIKLDDLFVVSETDDLRNKGVDVSRIDSILKDGAS